MSRFFAYKVTLALVPLAHSPGKIYSAFAYGTDLRAAHQRGQPSGKRREGKRQNWYKRRHFPPFPLSTVFLSGLSFPSPSPFPPFAAF